MKHESFPTLSPTPVPWGNIQTPVTWLECPSVTMCLTPSTLSLSMLCWAEDWPNRCYLITFCIWELIFKLLFRVPSSTEISLKLHVAQPDNDSHVASLKMYTSSDCEYEVSRMLASLLRFSYRINCWCIFIVASDTWWCRRQ